MPKILVLTKDKRTFSVFQKQIDDFFEGLVESYTVNDCQDFDQFDLILLSSDQLLKDTLPKEKVLIARRAIDIASLEQLVSLPEGTECLLVNNLPESTIETIEILKNLGLGLRLYPFYPGMNDFPKVNVAIVAEAVELVPTYIGQVINIGVRPIDFSTLIEISIKLNIAIDKANIHSARYMQQIICLSRRLSQSLYEVNELNHKLDAILNAVTDGIIATDSEMNIIKMNNAATKMLSLDKTFEKGVQGKKAHLIFPKLYSANEEQGHVNQLVSINDKKMVVTKKTIEIEEKHIGEVTAIQDVTRIQSLEQDIRKKIQKKGFSSKYSVSNIIGKSSNIKKIKRIMNKMAKSHRTVLILGENGTGKELFAHSIHHLSDRKNSPFIPVNFAGLPNSLAESELFGYEEGTFTGAVKGGKQGLFELAHNGTIFLDEIGDAPKKLQTLLLRVLQERQVMRVGGRSIIPVNVRVIAATNKDLKKLVEAGEFREDLYYRLFVLPLRIPSLRERKEDIPELLDYFIKEYSPTVPKIEEEVLKMLVDYSWPGNVRELDSVVQYMTTVMEGATFTTDDLPEQFKNTKENDSINSNDILVNLEKEGELIDYRTILSCLYEAKRNRKNIGRGTIVAYSENTGDPLTEQQVRKRMEVLRNFGLIYSGTKGQGSKISEKGISILKLLGMSLIDNKSSVLME